MSIREYIRSAHTYVVRRSRSFLNTVSRGRNITNGIHPTSLFQHKGSSPPVGLRNITNGIHTTFLFQHKGSSPPVDLRNITNGIHETFIFQHTLAHLQTRTHAPTQSAFSQRCFISFPHQLSSPAIRTLPLLHQRALYTLPLSL